MYTDSVLEIEEIKIIPKTKETIEANIKTQTKIKKHLIKKNMQITPLSEEEKVKAQKNPFDKEWNI